MEQIAKTFANSAGPEQHLIADLLLSIAPSSNFLIKHSDKNSYITLDEQLGKSKNNKNAVSVLKRRVSFMIADWSLEARAKDLSIHAQREESKKVGKRLSFPRLNIETIRSQQSFFTDLLVEAKRESQRRQTSRASTKFASANRKDKL